MSERWLMYDCRVRTKLSAVQNDHTPYVSAPPEAPPGGRVIEPVPLGRPGVVALARSFYRKHGKKLWWLHSLYALGLGLGVVFVAQKGFDQARWLSVSLVIAWLLVVGFFRLFGSGKEQAAVEAGGAKAKLRFYAVTYVIKNLYQGMLFFLLPFYWKSASVGTINSVFVAVLAVCAIVSTVDLVVDRVLLRWRVLAGFFHALTLFASLNLVIPALFPETRTVVSLLLAAGITALGFWTLNLRLSSLRNRWLVGGILLSVAASVLGAWFARSVIPPVPMYVSRSAVGPMLLPDGRLAMEVKTLHPSVIRELTAVTDVVVPGGKGDRLIHVWRHDQAVVHRATEDTSRVSGPHGAVRLRSTLQGSALPRALVGGWHVEVETEDGQLVGRAAFTVAD